MHVYMTCLTFQTREYASMKLALEAGWIQHTGRQAVLDRVNTCNNITDTLRRGAQKVDALMGKMMLLAEKQVRHFYYPFAVLTYLSSFSVRFALILFAGSHAQTQQV